jgi:hypothetical protein
MFRLLVTANVIPSSLIIVTLMMEAILSSEALVLSKATQLHITEDGILQLLTYAPLPRHFRPSQVPGCLQVTNASALKHIPRDKVEWNEVWILEGSTFV